MPTWPQQGDTTAISASRNNYPFVLKAVNKLCKSAPGQEPREKSTTSMLIGRSLLHATSEKIESALFLPLLYRSHKSETYVPFDTNRRVDLQRPALHRLLIRKFG